MIPWKIHMYRALLAIVTIVVGGGFVALHATEPPPLRSVRIGIVVDSEAPGLERTREVFCEEVASLLEGEFDVTFTDEDAFVGDWTIEKVGKALDSALQDPSIDLVVGIGSLVANEITHRHSLPKPTFAAFIMNVELQQPPLVDGVSGVNNLNYLTFPTNLEGDFKLFHAMTPFKKLTVLMNGFVLGSIPAIDELFSSIGRKLGIEVEVIPIWASPENGITWLPSDTEAVYVLPLTQLSDEGLKRIADSLIERKIPSFTLFRRRYLDQGFLASMSPDSDLPRLIRRLALNIQRTLLGENPKDFPVQVTEHDQLAVNVTTARAIGLSLPWKLVEEAVLLHDSDLEGGLVLSLEEAVRYGLEENLSLQAEGKAVAVGKEEVCKAGSTLLPQVRVGGKYAQIDKDRGRGSFGIRPEKGIWGAASLSQVVYSNEAFGNVRVEQYLQSARKHQFCSRRLDTILAVSQAYFNLLRAQTVEKTHLNNLERTRSHLKLARQRASIGATRISEVYRWETEYSNDLTVLTDVHYQTKIGETTLKRILNIPQDERLLVREVTLDEPYWERKGAWLREHVDNDKRLETFIGFSVVETLRQSEPIKQLQRQICSQAEILGIARRALWQPDVYVEATASDRYKEWGAGTEVKALYNRTDWEVALNVSFPLYTGGYKSAVKRQACAELKRLQLELRELVEVEKEEVRNAVYYTSSSHRAIGLSQKAAEFARKNFDLVQDSYSKGVVSIVDLLDAQNAALVADLETANAVYNFMADMMVYQHVVGNFDFFLTEADIQQWIENADRYFKEAI